MNTTEQLMRDAANGDAAALDWLIKFNLYAHALDDLVDEDMGVVDLVALPGLLRDVVQHPFYLRHAAALSLMMELVEAHYIASVGWGQVPNAIPGGAQLSDVLRCCGNLMVSAVAIITGGRTLAAKVTPRLWEESWATHHDGDGKAI